MTARRPLSPLPPLSLAGRLAETLRLTLLTAGLALRDIRLDLRLTLCMALAMAAVLAPLLVLFGLKFGIVSSMRDQLRNNAQMRELRPIGQYRLDDAWFAALAARPDVAFLAPNTRYLTTSIQLRGPDGGARVEVELIPTRAGDPLFPEDIAVPTRPLDVVLSQRAAEKLRLAPGDVAGATIGRIMDEQREAVRPELTVTGVLPVAAFERDAAFVPIELLLATEDYREGYAAPLIGGEGRPLPEGPRSFASFRIYAGDIDQVEGLRDHLALLHIDTQTRLYDIRLIQRFDAGLTIIFLVVAGLGGGGYLVSLGVSQVAAMETKTRQFGLLRLVGFSSAAIGLFPLIHAVVTALAGSALAIGLYYLMEPVINNVFRNQLALDGVICRITGTHLAIAVAGSAAAALLASMAAARRAMRVPPAEGLRDQ